MNDGAVKKLIGETYKTLNTAVNKNIKQDIPETMRRALQKNVFVFSGMKVYHELREVGSLSFTDKNGNPKSWHAFQKEANKLNVQYNEHYLRTEYNFATSSAQQADNWQEIEKNSDRYYLQYRTAQDDKVRESHAAMDNITLPADDSFWDSYYPPNGWNCRCVAVEVRQSKYEATDHDTAIKEGNKATTQIDKNGSNKAAIFRFNPGKSKKIFPPKHPYTSGKCGKLSAVWQTLTISEKINLANEADKCRARKIIEKRSKDPEETKKILRLPRKQQFEEIKDKNSSVKIKKHRLVKPKPNDPEDDYKDLIRTSIAAKKRDKDWEIMPEININDKDLKSKVFINYDSNKNPDFYDKKTKQYLDLKRPSALKNFVKNANDANKKDAIAILSDYRLNHRLSKDNMQKRAKAVFDDNHYKKNEVYFISKGRLYKYNRSDFE